MSILIKGMKMPKCCDECDFIQHGGDDWCYITEKEIPCDCPLIELPDHGDLIDRDEAAHEIWLIRCEECGAAEWACESCDNKTAMKKVMDAPVIIPAERSEE